MIQNTKAFTWGTLVIAATTSCAQGQDFPPVASNRCSFLKAAEDPQVLTNLYSPRELEMQWVSGGSGSPLHYDDPHGSMSCNLLLEYLRQGQKRY